MLLKSLLAFWLLAADAVLAASIPLRIITWNIRYATSSTENNEKPWWNILCIIWKDQCRQPHVIDMLSETAADAPSGGVSVIGLQEVLDNQLSDVMNGMGDNWAHIGFGRDDGKKKGEYNPIIYDSNVLNLVYSEQKWLSPTPDEVSFGWGAGSRRIVVIGVFEDKATGKRFMHANTHLDNVSVQARVEGIKVVVSRIQAVQAMYGPLGVTLTGDFNSDVNGDDAYQTLQSMNYLTEIWNSGATRLGTNQLTYTGFTTTGISRIDFIWLGPSADKLYSAQQFEILNNNVDGMIISDHRATWADLTLL